RITQLLQELSANPAPPWGDVLKALDRLKAAGGGDDAGPALAALEQVVRNGRDAGRAPEAVWRDIREGIQEKTRTARARWKPLGDLQVVVAVERALAFVTALREAAREVVTDPEVLRRLQERTVELLPPPEK